MNELNIQKISMYRLIRLKNIIKRVLLLGQYGTFFVSFRKDLCSFLRPAAEIHFITMLYSSIQVESSVYIILGALAALCNLLKIKLSNKNKRGPLPVHCTELFFSSLKATSDHRAGLLA